MNRSNISALNFSLAFSVTLKDLLAEKSKFATPAALKPVSTLGSLPYEKGPGSEKQLVLNHCLALTERLPDTLFDTSWSVVWPDDAATQAEPRGTAAKVLRQRIWIRRKSDWNTAPESCDSIDAPTADDGVRHCVDVGEVHLIMSKGQIQPIVRDKVVPDILLADRLLSFKVVQILDESCTSLAVEEGAGVIRIADQLRPRVCSLNNAAHG